MEKERRGRSSKLCKSKTRSPCGSLKTQANAGPHLQSSKSCQRSSERFPCSSPSPSPSPSPPSSFFPPPLLFFSHPSNSRLHLPHRPLAASESLGESPQTLRPDNHRHARDGLSQIGRRVRDRKGLLATFLTGRPCRHRRFDLDASQRYETGRAVSNTRSSAFAAGECAA